MSKTHKFTIPKKMPKWVPALFDHLGQLRERNYDPLKALAAAEWEGFAELGAERKPRASKASAAGADAMEVDADVGGSGKLPAVVDEALVRNAAHELRELVSVVREADAAAAHIDTLERAALRQ